MLCTTVSILETVEIFLLKVILTYFERGGFMAEDQNSSGLSIFEQKKIRRIWHKGEWYWSVVDVLDILSDSPQPRVDWARLKERINTEGFNEALTKIWADPS